MSHYALFIITSMGILKGSFKSIEWLKENKKERERDKEYIKELEEEIIRLRREMRICGVYSDKSNIEIFNKK